MTDDRGQALVFAVLILGLAAAALIGLRDVQERILDAVRDDRAGEAAAAAAGMVVSDAMFAGTARAGDHLSQEATAGLASDEDLTAAARSAAAQIALENGRPEPSEVSVHAYGYEIEVHLTLAGRQHIALLEPPP